LHVLAGNVLGEGGRRRNCKEEGEGGREGGREEEEKEEEEEEGLEDSLFRG
jgi:hypothetical protein